MEKPLCVAHPLASAFSSIHQSLPTDTLVNLAHDPIFICLFVFPFCVHLHGLQHPARQSVSLWPSAQSWLLSFWSPSIPDVGKTSVLSSCLVLADSQTAAAVPCSCMGLHCVHRARPCQDQKTHRGSSSLHQVQRKQMCGLESGRVCAVSNIATALDSGWEALP